MWPWGHLALGYLAYSLGVRHFSERAPTDGAAVAVVLGTQFPDLVDKPLAWTFGVLPSGRSLAHSLFAAALILGLLKVGLRRTEDAELVNAFGVGYVSHIAGDAVYPLLSGEYSYLGFLVWPLVSGIDYDTEPGFFAHFRSLTLTPETIVGLGLSTLVFGLWLYDGTPGVTTLRAVSKRLGRVLSKQ